MKIAIDPDFKIDCIAMKRQIQSEIAAETEGMTPLQRQAHYRHLATKSQWGHLFSGAEEAASSTHDRPTAEAQ